MKTHLLSIACAVSTVTMLSACGGTGPGSFTSTPTPTPTPTSAPTVTVTAPATATAGLEFPVSWASTDATSCDAGSLSTATDPNKSVTKTETTASTVTYSVTCTGAGGSATGTATVRVDAALPEGLWQGTMGNGRAVSGVVTKEGDYWLVYTRAANDNTVVGFYTGNAAATTTTAPDGTFTSSNLRDVSFDAGTTAAGVVTSATYSAKSVLSGSFDPVSSGHSGYTVSGSFGVTATIFGSPLTVPMTVTSGSYSDATGTGSWSLSADLTGMGFGTITFDQTFTLDATTGLGNLAVATNCVGNGIACGGVGPNFNGPINAGGPIVAGLQNWVVTTPSFGSPTFAPTLTAVQTGLPPITPDTFNLGTYNPQYETAPSLSDVAGTYTAGSTAINKTMNADASLTVDSTGKISGTESASFCSYAATIAPHATGNVYDVTKITFSDVGGTCVYSSETFTGVATYNGTNQLTITAVNAARDKGFMVVATKQ